MENELLSERYTHAKEIEFQRYILSNARWYQVINTNAQEPLEAARIIIVIVIVNQ